MTTEKKIDMRFKQVDKKFTALWETMENIEKNLPAEKDHSFILPYSSRPSFFRDKWKGKGKQFS